MSSEWNSIWNDLSEGMSLNPGRSVRYNWLLSNLQTGPTLDFGCGDGSFLETLISRGYDAYGYDNSTRGLAIAKVRLRNLNLNSSNIFDSLDDLLSRELQFSNIVLSEVIEHIEFPSQFLRDSIVPIMNSGTRILITVPSGPMSWFDELIGHFRHYDEKLLRLHIEEAGLKVTAVYRIGFPIVNLVRAWAIIRGKRVKADLTRPEFQKRFATWSPMLSLIHEVSSKRSRLGWQLVGIAELPSIIKNS